MLQFAHISIRDGCESSPWEKDESSRSINFSIELSGENVTADRGRKKGRRKGCGYFITSLLKTGLTVRLGGERRYPHSVVFIFS